MLNHAEEDVFGFRVGDDVGPLTEVVEHQCHKHEVPRPDNRLTTQMAHVGIKRLATCSTENYLGKDKETGQAVFVEKPGGIPGGKCLENYRVIDNRKCSGQRQGEEPDNHQRSESPSYLVGSLVLKDKKNDRNDGGNKYQEVLRRMLHSRYQFNALNGGEDRDCRGYNTVAYQQADADI